MNPTPLERIKKGLTSERDHATSPRRDEKIAATFVENPQLERVLEMKRSDPARFAAIDTPALRMQIGGYLSQKTAHRRLTAARKVDELEAMIAEETDPVILAALKGELRTTRTEATRR